MTNNSDNLSAGSAPGVQAHVPGEDSTDKSAAGVMPEGTATDTVTDGRLPAGDGLSGGGDSVGDDDTVPGTDESAGEAQPDDYGNSDAASGHS